MSHSLMPGACGSALFVLITLLPTIDCHAAAVHWAGPGGDLWNTNSSPHNVDAANPFTLGWSRSPNEGQYTRPSGVVLADVGVANTPYVFGSTGWGENRAYRVSRTDGAMTGWTAVNGINDSGQWFRIAISSDASRLFHIDEGFVVRAYSASTNPGGAAMWTQDASILTPGLSRMIKVGPDGRVYGHRNGAAALDPDTGNRVWWSAGDPEGAVHPGAFWNTGPTYRYVVAGTTTQVSAYDIQSAAGSGPVWSFVDPEGGYAGPTIDPATGAIYVFRETRLLKLTSAGGFVWRSTAIGAGEVVRTYGALSRDGATYYCHSGSESNAGKLYAFRTSNGTIKWSIATGGHAREGIGGPVVSANGLVLLGNGAKSPGDNRVLAIEDSAGVAPVIRGQLDLNDHPEVGAPWISIGPGGSFYFDSLVAPNDELLFAFRPPVLTAPAPAGLTATPYATTARLQWTPALSGDAVGYALFRKDPGGSYPVFPTRYVGPRADFTDYGLQAEQTYSYRIAACNAGGAVISPFTEVEVTLQSAAMRVSRQATRDLLVAVYTDGYSPAEVSAMKRGIELSLEFYSRTTAGRLVLMPTWLMVDGPLPGPDWASPALIDDLRARGIRDHMFDLAYLVGQGLPGCLGGYVVFGSTCAALGTVCGVPYPGDDPAIDYTIAWTFTHEIHHALEASWHVAGSVPPRVLDCHFPWNYPGSLGATSRHIDSGTHYDGIAAINRDYADGWWQFPAPFDGIIECVDQDLDGLPDSDNRVWTDEARFGSSPAKTDTDDDGLPDPAEYASYNFRSSDPGDADSDDDGRSDGIDAEPLYETDLNLLLFGSAPVIDGTLEGTWRPFVSGYYYTRNGSSFELDTHLGWRPEGLYVGIKSTRNLRFKLSLDGSGQDGRFESPVRHSAGATDTDNLDHKATHVGDSWGDEWHIAFAYGDATARVGTTTIPGSQVASTFQGGRYTTEAFIPAVLPRGAAYTWYPAGAGTPVVNGLTLAAGQVLGVGLTLTNAEDSDDDEFSGTWTSLFETHAYVDLTLRTTLVGIDDDPVGLAPSVGLHFANPFRIGGPITLQLDAAPRAPGAAVPAVDIYDVLGRHVRSLHPVAADGRTLRVDWNGSDGDGRRVPAGVYLVRGRDGARTWQRKLVLTR